MKHSDRNKILYIFICMLCILFSVCSCKTEKCCIEREVVKDSIIFRTDSVEVKVPYEKVVEVCPELDTLTIETSVAKSKAWLDTTYRILRGEIENKPVGIKTEVVVKDHYYTVQKTKTITKYVIKYKKHVPKFIKWMLIVLIAYLLYSQRKNLLKLIKLLRKLILRV